MSLQDYKKAGQIAGEALVYCKKLVKEGVLLHEVTKKTEEKIIQLNGKLAFPVQISLNNVAAHNYAGIGDETRFQFGDLVKLDLGVHINGYIADTACSLNISNDSDLELIRASKDALREAISLMKPGIKVYEIGKAIEEVIVGYGYKPVRNLNGHEVEKYLLHAGINIPNYNNKDGMELEEGQVFAVEPFASTGIGKVEEGNLSGVYKIINLKNIRSGREILKHIYENYKELPFSKDWLKRDFDEFKLNFGFRVLEREGVVHRYPQLIEKEGFRVSQAEHTIIVGDKPIVITKISD